MFLGKKSLPALAAAMMFAAACTPQENAYNASQGGITGGGGLDKADVGTGLGAIGGAVIGSQFGHGAGRGVSVVAGTLLGGAIGHSIGSSMDRADMQYYNQAQYQALETAPPGQALPWSNPGNGHSGTFVPQAPYQTAQGQYCREYTQTINVGGQIQRGYGTACRQPDGNWQIVSQQ